jgi:xylono-1,5-lactonase
MLAKDPSGSLNVRCQAAQNFNSPSETRQLRSNGNVNSLQTISTGHGLLEGPTWDSKLGFIVADASVGGVWRITTEGLPEVVIPNRRGIGGIALHQNGGVIIGGRNIAFKWPVSDGRQDTIILLESDPSKDIVGFNDMTTDAAGRIYVGSLAFVAMASDRGGKAGQLHLIDLDGTTRTVANDVLLTNGLGFSPDGTRLYHADSLRHTVYVYDVDANGDLRARRSFIELEGAMPDGLAIDSAGNIWVAAPYSGLVRGFAPSGKELESIKIPVPMVTSLCFGGEDLRTMYIVSGSEGLDTQLGAGVYSIRVNTPGLPRSPARIAIPAKG